MKSVLSYGVARFHQLHLLSYTTAVVYSRDDEEVGFLAPKTSPKIQPQISFLTGWQHWLGLDQLENFFRSILNTSYTLQQNFKNFLFNRIFY